MGRRRAAGRPQEREGRERKEVSPHGWRAWGSVGNSRRRLVGGGFKVMAVGLVAGLKRPTRIRSNLCRFYFFLEL